MDEFIEEKALFWQYPVITEKTFYLQNKEDPNYLGLPWATILDKGYNIKNLFYQLKPLVGKKKYYYTCCQHISFRKLIPIFRLLGIKSVFTPHKKIGECILNGVELLPCPLYAVNVEDVSRHTILKNVNYQTYKKPIWFSFIGAYQYDYLTTVRERIFHKYEKTNRKDIVVKRSGDWHFNELVYHYSQNKNGNENKTTRHVTNTDIYNKVLLDSRFSLCPSGTGPNSIRFWESLAVGTIPVLLSDYLELPFHEDWNEAIVFASENDIESIEKKLNAISLDQEREMREKCLMIYDYFKDNYKGHQYFSFTKPFSREQITNSLNTIENTINKQNPFLIGCLSKNETILCGKILSNEEYTTDDLDRINLPFKDKQEIKEYAKLYTSGVNACDLIGVYDADQMYDSMLQFHYFMARIMYKKKRVAIDAFSLTMVKMLCKDKSILIIDTEKNNAFHQRLYSNSTNVQTYNISDTFNTGDSWKLHFETIKNEVCDIVCDIVIVNSNGYGMLLSHYLYKKCHKSIIQITSKSTFFD